MKDMHLGDAGSFGAGILLDGEEENIVIQLFGVLTDEMCRLAD